jgi:butanol dehydrogenase
MEKFKLQIPTIIFFGSGEFERVKRAARETGKNALIVIGQGSVKKYGYLEKLEKYLNEENIKHTLFEGIEPNPRSTTINKAAKLAKEINADMIIALGGGSVMDAAKGIAISAKSGEDIWDYCGYGNNKTKKVTSALPIICIPTLAATGSEVDSGSVITNAELKRKAVIHNFMVIPKFAIIDPDLTLTVPTGYIIDGAVDIICHCIETYASNNKEVRVPDYITLGLIKTVKEATEALLENPKDADAREDLSWASSVAMIGILSGRNGGWPMHLIEHGLSGIYDVSHGLGLAWLMPACLKFSLKQNKEKITKLAGFMLHGNLSHYSDGEKAVSDIKMWLNTIGALRDIKKCGGIEKLDIEAVAKATIETYGDEKGYIYGVVPMNEKDIIWVLTEAFGPSK